MAKNFKQPAGVSDDLTHRCYAKNKIESSLLDCFCKFGYKQIDTPVLEYGDLYSGGVGKVSLKNLFKLTDSDGSLLVLRPDMTMPISRIVSTKMPEGKYRLCYRGRTFRFFAQDGMREFSQVGIELMGASGVCYDAEVVALAIVALKKSGLKDFIVDIGNVAFFKGLLSSLSINEEEKDELAALVESKDSIGEELFAKRVGLTKSQQESILKMPMLFGGEEIFDEAEKYCVNEMMFNAVRELRELNAILKAQGFEQYVSYDLSLVGEMSYYSGLVFKGMCEGVGSSLLSGGRYDHLCDGFDKNIPSVGFAVAVDRVLTALQNFGNLPRVKKADIVVGCDGQSVAELISFVMDTVDGGKKVVNLSCCDKHDVEKYAIENSIKQVYYFESGEKTRLV